jgi:hypothetical protein
MTENDDSGYGNQSSRSAFPLSSLKIATRAEVVVKNPPATEERNLRNPLQT